MTHAHFGLLCVWAVVLLVEFALEAAGRAMIAHFWIDVLLEIPIVLGVLVTGVLLLARTWPPTTLQVVKIASGLVAIGINLYCGALVIRRYRTRVEDPRIRWTILGLPFGILAAVLGMMI